MSIEKALKDKELKITKARIIVATILEQANTPLKIESIYELIPEPKPDLVTVYRILESFEKVGLVHQIDLRHGHAHYEWGHSHHLVCTNCQKIFPLHGDDTEKILKDIAKKQKDFTITDHSLEFFGTCKECSN